jgi:uncharacterized protein YdeI (YjbR/CyaY-like superfamily)
MATTQPKPLPFTTPAAFRAWLKKNHRTSDGIWIKFYKKGSGVKSINYAEALDEALCYGWIDSQTKSFDKKAYLQKFSARRSKSLWSKRNREHVARLIKEGRMTEAGLAEIDAAKKDGRWDAAYDSSANMVIPEDFMKELVRNKKAQAFFKTLNKTNLYAIGWRLQTAKKEETRLRRIMAIIEQLEKGKKFH